LSVDTFDALLSETLGNGDDDGEERADDDDVSFNGLDEDDPLAPKS
jgi:hypothetical protein